MQFKNYIANYKNLNSFPHALLVESNGCNDYDFIVKSYLKSIMCTKQNIFCDQCIVCQKINSNSYFDLLVFDCSSQLLSKDDVLAIQNNFSKASTENNNIKLYVIINIENSNKEAINSLLKFIEEPPSNTYALFFCKNINNVLNTIKSRCQKIKITNLNNVNDELVNYCFDSIKQYQNFKQNFDYENEMEFFKNLVQNKNINLQVEFINKIKNSSVEEIGIFIKIIAFFCNIEKKINVIELKKYLHLNLNKILLAHKILNIVEK